MCLLTCTPPGELGYHSSTAIKFNFPLNFTSANALSSCVKQATMVKTTSWILCGMMFLLVNSSCSRMVAEIASYLYGRNHYKYHHKYHLQSHS
jgi:hypothetical protein